MFGKYFGMSERSQTITCIYRERDCFSLSIRQHERHWHDGYEDLFSVMILNLEW